MKFLADMGISPKTVDFLTEFGYDATHLHSEGLERLPDRDILAKALGEERIVLTHDLDFGELVAASGSKLPSVITFRLRNMHPDRVNHYLQEIIRKHQEVLEQGAAISVTEGRLRVRLLPIKEGNQD
jgi:predicted nuclease of predicted toxin-antitoxin system